MMSYSQRAESSLNPVGARLLRLMDEKQTNLAVAADVITAAELLSLADSLGPHIALFKTHIDIIEDFTPDLPFKLTALAEKHHFMLFEDRKFADIGHTSRLQYEGGIYKIASWADITNAHPLLGEELITSLQAVGLPLNRALLLLAELSSKGTLITEAYTQTAIRLAEAHSDFVIGFICQRKLSAHPALIHMTPGIHLSQAGDKEGQQYNTPHHAIAHNHTDLIIVGRGIIQAPNPALAATTYRTAAWHAYLHRLTKE